MRFGDLVSALAEGETASTTAQQQVQQQALQSLQASLGVSAQLAQGQQAFGEGFKGLGMGKQSLQQALSLKQRTDHEGQIFDAEKNLRNMTILRDEADLDLETQLIKDLLTEENMDHAKKLQKQELLLNLRNSRMKAETAKIKEEGGYAQNQADAEQAQVKNIRQTFLSNTKDLQDSDRMVVGTGGRQMSVREYLSDLGISKTELDNGILTAQRTNIDRQTSLVGQHINQIGWQYLDDQKRLAIQEADSEEGRNFTIAQAAALRAKTTEQDMKNQRNFIYYKGIEEVYDGTDWNNPIQADQAWAKIKLLSNDMTGKDPTMSSMFAKRAEAAEKARQELLEFKTANPNDTDGISRLEKKYRDEMSSSLEILGSVSEGGIQLSNVLRMATSGLEGGFLDHLPWEQRAFMMSAMLTNPAHAVQVLNTMEFHTGETSLGSTADQMLSKNPAFYELGSDKPLMYTRWASDVTVRAKQALRDPNKRGRALARMSAVGNDIGVAVDNMNKAFSSVDGYSLARYVENNNLDLSRNVAKNPRQAALVNYVVHESFRDYPTQLVGGAWRGGSQMIDAISHTLNEHEIVSNPGSIRHAMNSQRKAAINRLNRRLAIDIKPEDISSYFDEQGTFKPIDGAGTDVQDNQELFELIHALDVKHYPQGRGRGFDSKYMEWFLDTAKEERGGRGHKNTVRYKDAWHKDAGELKKAIKANLAIGEEVGPKSDDPTEQSEPALTEDVTIGTAPTVELPSEPTEDQLFWLKRAAQYMTDDEGKLIIPLPEDRQAEISRIAKIPGINAHFMKMARDMIMKETAAPTPAAVTPTPATVTPTPADTTRPAGPGFLDIPMKEYDKPTNLHPSSEPADTSSGSIGEQSTIKGRYTTVAAETATKAGAPILDAARKGYTHEPVGIDETAFTLVHSYDDFIEKSSQKHGVPAGLIRSVIYAESKGDPKAWSGARAAGLMQLVEATAKEMGLDWKDKFDPAKNIDAGTRYLSQLLKKYKDLEKALAAYNWGMGHLANYMDKNPGEFDYTNLKVPETKKYLPEVINLYLRSVNQGEG